MTLDTEDLTLSLTFRFHSDYNMPIEFAYEFKMQRGVTEGVRLNTAIHC